MGDSSRRSYRFQYQAQLRLSLPFTNGTYVSLILTRHNSTLVCARFTNAMWVQPDGVVFGTRSPKIPKILMGIQSFPTNRQWRYYQKVSPSGIQSLMKTLCSSKTNVNNLYYRWSTTQIEYNPDSNKLQYTQQQEDQNSMLYHLFHFVQLISHPYTVTYFKILKQVIQRITGIWHQ